MSDDRAEDPEVIADRIKRAASERDTTRSRQEARWEPPRFATTWKCRHPRCDVQVPVTPDVVELLGKFNTELGRRDERPIPQDGVVLCEPHRTEAWAYRASKLRERSDRLAEVIRQLKASPSPHQEHELIAKLREYHHPDVEGLLGCLAEKAGGKTKRRV